MNVTWKTPVDQHMRYGNTYLVILDFIFGVAAVAVVVVAVTLL